MGTLNDLQATHNLINNWVHADPCQEQCDKLREDLLEAKLAVAVNKNEFSFRELQEKIKKTTTEASIVFIAS